MALDSTHGPESGHLPRSGCGAAGHGPGLVAGPGHNPGRNCSPKYTRGQK